MKTSKKGTVVIAMYTHVEGYPPSLNAIQQLSKSFDFLVVVHRNTMANTWHFPTNVQLTTTGQFASYDEVSKKSGVWKIVSFIKFVSLFHRTLKLNSPDLIIIHEPIALLAWGIICKFYRKRHHVWYHNHDVILGNESFLFKLSHRMQNSIFSSLDIFSLPANERKEFFPIEKLSGKYFYVPNYPGTYLYNNYYQPRKIEKQIRILFQGKIAAGHCIEQIVHLMSDKKFSIDLMLVLKGFKDENYFKELMTLAKDLGVDERIVYYEVGSYQSVPEVTSTCHIGIGIHTKTDVMNRTLGSASNKIYEYAALGLPVLLFDNSHFKMHLGKYKWAFFTNGEAENIKEIILKIREQYEQTSLAARKDFLSHLNFETCFEPALKYASFLVFEGN